MSTIIQVVLPVISGVIIGALCFGVWLSGLMFVYFSVYDSFGSGGFLFDSLSFQNAIVVALISGLIFGCVQGFFVSLISKLFGASSSSRSILSSFVVTELLILFSFLIISFDSNPITMFTEALFGRFYDLLKTSFILLVPSILVGMITTNIISRIDSK